MDNLKNIIEKPLHKHTRCRFCAKQNTCAPASNLSEPWVSHTVAEHLNVINYLKIDYLDLSPSNKLPKTTCEACHDTLQMAYSFFRTVQQSQFDLKTLFNIPVNEESNIAHQGSDMEYKEKSFLQEDISSFEVGNEENNLNHSEATVAYNSNTHNTNDNRTELSYCRFCAQHRNTEDLLRMSNEICNEYVQIKRFFKLDYLDLSHSKLPKTSCEYCHSTFKSLYNFFINTKCNQEILSSIYNIPVRTVPMESIIKVERIQERHLTELCKIIYDETEGTLLSTDTVEDTDNSWSSYKWMCCHCRVVFATIADLRSHSKDKHNMCYALACADCDEQLGVLYNDFVEHVRRHRDHLRLYCEYCNEKLDNKKEFKEHVKIHNEGTQKICEHCGDVLPFANTLQWHKRMYGQLVSPAQQSQEHGTWEHYEWACQECGLKLPDVVSLRAHTQKLHATCFAMKCMDCSKVSSNYRAFVSHVTGHRPYLTNYCMYCNRHFDNTDKLNRHVIEHVTSQQRPCNLCGQTFKDNIQLAKHKRKKYNGTKRVKQGKIDNKPLAKRRRLTNTRAEDAKNVTMKRKGSLTQQDLTCNICDKLFKTMTNLSRHVKTHDDTRPRDSICLTCGRAFLTASTLKEHAKTHNSVKPEVCQVCKKEFYTKHKLKAHIVTHLESKPFVCDECGTNFKTKKRLKCHMKSHSAVKPYKCVYCFKEFKFKENLKTHEYQHTGERPYSCEHCERTFTNWTNCNKHMIRKHGVSLARTKITARGRVAINRRTGEVNTIASGEVAEGWLSEMLKPERRGKKSTK